MILNRSERFWILAGSLLGGLLLIVTPIFTNLIFPMLLSLVIFLTLEWKALRLLQKAYVYFSKKFVIPLFFLTFIGFVYCFNEFADFGRSIIDIFYEPKLLISRTDHWKDHPRLKRVAPGMGRNKVLQILGKPYLVEIAGRSTAKINPDTLASAQEWYYDLPTHAEVTRIWFDPEGVAGIGLDNETRLRWVVLLEKKWIGR